MGCLEKQKAPTVIGASSNETLFLTTSCVSQNIGAVFGYLKRHAKRLIAATLTLMIRAMQRLPLQRTDNFSPRPQELHV